MPRGQVIRHGSARVRIFVNRSGERVRYEVRYRNSRGELVRKKFSSQDAARSAARSVASDLATGGTSAHLTSDDAARYRAACLSAARCLKPIERVAAEYAECVDSLRSALGPDAALPSLSDLSRAWLDQRKRGAWLDPALSVEDCVRQFLDDKSKLGLSGVWLANLRCYLKKFSAKFSGPIAALRASSVNEWFLHLPGLSARARNNHLGAVQNLFSMPALAHHPDRDAIRALTPIAPPDVAVELWRPHDFRNFLNAALQSSPHVVPYLVLGGFCGIRCSEIFRLEWSDVFLEARRVALPRRKTKGTATTRRDRVVLIPDNALDWLSLFHKSSGAVCCYSECTLRRTLRRLSLALSLPRIPRNGLRKSATTYAEIFFPTSDPKSFGHSASVRREFYVSFNPSSQFDARDWFAIRPESSVPS